MSPIVAGPQICGCGGHPQCCGDDVIVQEHLVAVHSILEDWGLDYYLGLHPNVDVNILCCEIIGTAMNRISGIIWPPQPVHISWPFGKPCPACAAGDDAHLVDHYPQDNIPF